MAIIAISRSTLREGGKDQVRLARLALPALGVEADLEAARRSASRSACARLRTGFPPQHLERARVVDRHGDVPVAAGGRPETEVGFRDAVRVFLMTSSGARGMSFPKTDWIIAAVPRFDIEAALMEIAQLIYRGRGSYLNDAGGGSPGTTRIGIWSCFVLRSSRASAATRGFGRRLLSCR